MKDFNTVLKEGVYRYDIERSKFIATIVPVDTEERAKAIIEATNKAYWDATHTCTAYIIGEDKMTQRFNDDGEPQGTAGIPMLEVLKKADLTNVLAMVTRYFGGIKLGANGLVRAYSQGVSEGIHMAEIVANQVYYDCMVDVDYGYYGAMEYYLKEKAINILDITYADHVGIRLLIHPSQWEIFLEDVANKTNGSSEVVKVANQRALTKDGILIRVVSEA